MAYCRYISQLCWHQQIYQKDLLSKYTDNLAFDWTRHQALKLRVERQRFPRRGSLANRQAQFGEALALGFRPLAEGLPIGQALRDVNGLHVLQR